jgi:hypothetical protein
VGDALADVPARDRDEALAELTQLLTEEAEREGETAALALVGEPSEYAAAVRAALTEGVSEVSAPQGRILGMPYDFRGASVDRIGDRIWNPADPRIFTPRLFGVGWTINFGALAVKIGLIRPDDAGDEAFERVPAPVVAAALAVPALVAAATVVLVAVTWPTLPAEVPVHWNAAGAPDRWSSKPVAFGFLLALSVLPLAITYAKVVRRDAGARARVLSAAALGTPTVLVLGIVVATLVDATGGASGQWIGLVLVAALLASFLLLYVPVRFGMRAEWRESLGRSGKDV